MASFKRDPIEYDPRKSWMVEEAEREAAAELTAAGVHPGMGYCHLLWLRQKRILKEKHGIKWWSPAEMNPDILFD